MTRTLQELGLSIKRLQMRHHRAADEALAPLGISLVQWDALRHVEKNPDASLHDLALLTFQTDQSFGALAGRLIERELIVRVPGPGRAIRHKLTTRGADARRAGGRILDRVLAQSFAPLSPAQLVTFGKLLATLLATDDEEAEASD